MYTETEWQSLRAQVQKRRTLLLCVCGAVAALSILALILRNQMVSAALMLASVCGFIFFYDLTVRPLSSYAKLLDKLLHGRTHEDTVTYDRTDDYVSMVDGVRCHAVYGTTGDEAGHRYEHVFYLDAEKPKPDCRPGEEITFVCHEKMIGSWRRAEA